MEKVSQLDYNQETKKYKKPGVNKRVSYMPWQISDDLFVK